MSAAVPLSDDKLRAAGKAVCYVKEEFADVARSSIRTGSAVMLLQQADLESALWGGAAVKHLGGESSACSFI